MKYVEASALLRVLFAEPGLSVQLEPGARVISSRLIEVETFRAIDRERLLGSLDDVQTATKRSELGTVLTMMDLVAIDERVIARAKDSFAVNVRALDAIHVATAELLASEAGDEPVEFWTHDERQATAALSRGLSVFGV
ncbi:MAG: PIN domain-containing protein [Gemmatimonadota bacterium]